MRYHHQLITVAALAALLGSGCVTGGDNEQRQLDRLRGVAQVAAYTSAALFLQDKPEQRAAFVSARAAVAVLVQSQNFDPTALALALSSTLPITELRSEKALIIVTSATLLYETALGGTVIEKPKVVQAFAEGILSGLDMALLAQPQP